MAVGWTTEETGALVSIWGQANVQNELDGVGRNRTVFEKIASVVPSAVHHLRLCGIFSLRNSLSLEVLLALPRIAWVLRNR